MQELPQIHTSSYAAANYCGGMDLDPFAQGWIPDPNDTLRQLQKFKELHSQREIQTEEPKPMANSTRRIVQVFIADPNENVPLDQSVLYQGDQKLTDLTDNELFFEAPIVEKLKSHNANRVKWLDKEASKRSGKDVLLDAARIRDLKMVVVTIAQF